MNCIRCDGLERLFVYYECLIVCLQREVKNESRSYCQFYEEIWGKYYRYRSVENNTRYLGFNRFGNPIRKPFLMMNSTKIPTTNSTQNGSRHNHGRPECSLFLKYDPKADINRHNNLVKQMGGMEPWKLYSPVRKPLSGENHPRRGVPKNSLLQADSARKFNHATHRHRHSSHQKSHRNVSGFRRRRHDSRRPIEANKY